MDFSAVKFSAHRYIFALLLFFSYALAASSAEHSFLQKWRTLNAESYSFAQIMDYDVPKPYAYRILMPGLVNGLYSLTLIKTVAESQTLVSRGAVLYARDDRIKNWSLELQAKYVISVFLMFLFLLVAMFSLRGITRHFFKNPMLADIGPIIFSLFLPLTFRGDGGFIYDFSELGLYFLALYFILKKANVALLLVIPLLIMNKESGLLMLAFSAIIWFSTAGKKEAFLSLSAQAAVAFIAYVWVKVAFSGQSGGTIEFHFFGNLDFWGEAKIYFVSMMSTSAFLIPFPKPYNILFIFIFGWMILHKWNEKPKLLKMLFLASAVLNLPLFILFSYRDEFRNLSMMYPFVYLLICYSVNDYYETRRSAASP